MVPCPEGPVKMFQFTELCSKPSPMLLASPSFELGWVVNPLRGCLLSFAQKFFANSFFLPCARVLLRILLALLPSLDGGIPGHGPGYLKCRISDFALHLLRHFLTNDQVWFGSGYSLRDFVRVAAIIVYRLLTLHWGFGGDVKRGVLFAMKGQHFRRSRVCWYRHF